MRFRSEAINVIAIIIGFVIAQMIVGAATQYYDRQAHLAQGCALIGKDGETTELGSHLYLRGPVWVCIEKKKAETAS